MDKNADLTFNISATGTQSITSNIRFSTQDEGSAKLTFYLFKDGVEMPLNAVVGKLVMRMSDGSKFIDTVNIVNKVNGIAEYKLTSEQLKHYGKVIAELYLNYEEQKMSVHRFTFTILQALVDEDIPVLTEFYVDDFETLKSTINSMADETKEIITTVGSEVEVAKRKADEVITLINQNQVAKKSELQATNEQLATKVTKINYDADKAYMEARINALTSGFKEEAFATLADLQAKYPQGAVGIFAVQEDGFWYFWMDGSGWTAGGEFKDAGLADGTVTITKLDYITKKNLTSSLQGKRTRNLFNKYTAKSNFYVQWNTGILRTPTDGLVYYVSDYINVISNEFYVVHYMNQVAFYDEFLKYVDGIDNSSNSFYSFQVPEKAKFMIITTHEDYLDKQQVERGEVPTHFIPHVIAGDENLDYLPIKGERTKNLVVKSEVIQDKYVRWDNGTFGTNTNYVMAIMEAEELTNYYANYGDQFAYVDINKNYIDGKNTNTTPNEGTLLYTPARTRFIIASIPKGKLDMAQIEKGSSTTSYVEGGIKIKEGYILDSPQQSKPFRRVKDIMIEFLYDPDKTQEVVFLGNSKTHGVGGTGWKQDGEQIGDTIFRTSPNSYCWANAMCHLITDKTGKPARNWGTTGRTSSFIRDNLASLIRIKDKIVFLCIGTNDRNADNNTTLEQLYENLIYIGEYVRSLGKEIIFVSPSPVSIANETDPVNIKNYHQEDVDNIIARAASYFNMDYISIYKGMLNYCELKDITVDSLLSDGLHENDEGYKVDFHIVADHVGLSRKRDGATW